MDRIELQRVVEAILFAAGERIEVSRLSQVLEVDPDEIITAVDALADELAFNRRGIRFPEWQPGGTALPAHRQQTRWLQWPSAVLFVPFKSSPHR